MSLIGVLARLSFKIISLASVNNRLEFYQLISVNDGGLIDNLL